MVLHVHVPASFHGVLHTAFVLTVLAYALRHANIDVLVLSAAPLHGVLRSTVHLSCFLFRNEEMVPLLLWSGIQRGKFLLENTHVQKYLRSPQAAYLVAEGLASLPTKASICPKGVEFT